ncbi:HAMP domain-containing histidine kinase, partial [Candidatus Fermentibacterales bacterium]|nr:HAMP domain-containing histidine kinase [Candidatus Fermentibacterales bacterium]
AKTVELTWAKTRFTYEVSHELKAPLASVYNILTLILDGYLDNDPGKQRELLARAKVRINELVKLLNDLLVFSHLEERTKAIQKRETDIRKVIESLVGDMDGYASQNGVRIEWTLADDLPVLFGNPELLGRVFENIIHNAIKYSDSGDKVSVGVRGENGTLVFVVTDEGMGIDSEDLHKVFDIFFRGKNARPEHKKEGMGLGLSIVRRIVDAHDGCIRVTSRLQEGTTVEVRIPALSGTEQ